MAKALLMVVLLAATSCASAQQSIAIADSAADILGLIAMTADAAEDEPPSQPLPLTIRAVRRGPELHCANGRSFHARCVLARAGEVCFFETDEGTPFDCDTPACATVPANLQAWCGSPSK
jgi:hypothetical protein